MRAVVLQEYGGPEKLKFEDNVPEPQIGGRTVLIAAAAASVNPIDWKMRSGARQKDFPLSFPAILGRDVSGVVRAVGVNVKLWFIKTKRRRVFDAGGASLEGSALHGVVFDRSGRPQKRAGEARLPGSGRESPSDPDSEGVRFGAGNC
jgi:NADPH:quinone reductase-like Zn-dependent oxidoreductase